MPEVTIFFQEMDRRGIRPLSLTVEMDDESFKTLKETIGAYCSGSPPFDRDPFPSTTDVAVIRDGAPETLTLTIGNLLGVAIPR